MNNGFYSFPQKDVTVPAVTIRTLDQQEDFINYTIQNATSNYEGEVIEGSIDSAVQLFDLVCLYNGGSIWYQVTQGNDKYITRILGIYLGNNKVLLEGTIVIRDNVNINGPYVQNLVQGGAVYVKESTTTGEIDCTIPAAGYIRRLGHCYYRSIVNTSYWIFKFKPSIDWFTP